MLRTMRSFLLAVLVCVVACKSSEDDAGGQACTEDEILVDGVCFSPGVPKDGCAPGFRWDAQACVPAVPETCPAGTITSLAKGACEAVGIETCAEGFVRDGEGSCKPVLPASSCAAGTFATPGESACHAPDECGADAFPSGSLYVDQSAADGGDGTKAKPVRTIAAAIALAKDGETIAITDGTYVENVTIDKTITLLGRCSATVTVRAADATRPAIAITAGKPAVRSLAVTGGAGIELGRAEATLASLWIHDVDDIGVHTTHSDSKLSLTGSLVEKATILGVSLEGGVNTLEKVVVRDTRPRASGDRGIGISVETPRSVVTSLTAKRVLLERNADVGMLLHGSNVVIESSAVLDTRPRQDGTFGAGINALAYSDASASRGSYVVRDSFFAGNTLAGVMIGGVPVTLERTVIRDTRPQTDASRPYARGIVISEHPTSKHRGELVMKSSVVEHNQEMGVFVSSSDFSAEGSIIRTTTTRANGTGGLGVYSQISPGRTDAPVVTLTRSLVDDNREIGVYGIGARLSLVDSTVRNTKPSKESGWGVHAVVDARVGPSELSITGSVLEDNVGYGAFLYGANGTIEGSLVRRTKVGVEDFTQAGVVVNKGELTLKTSVVDENEQVGVFVLAAKATVESVTIRRMRARPPVNSHGVGLVVFPNADAAPGELELRTSTIDDVLTGGVILGAAQASLDGVLVRDVKLEPSTSLYGDGILTRVAYDMRGSVSIARTLVERTARAGIAVLGSDASLASSRMVCATIAIDVEPYGGGPPGLVDQGGNVCGCGATGACVAVSANLVPYEIEPPGSKR